MQPAASGRSAQFDPRSEVSNSLESRREAGVDTLRELEPMAAALKLPSRLAKLPATAT